MNRRQEMNTILVFRVIVRTRADPQCSCQIAVWDLEVAQEMEMDDNLL
jgi:hypothetical protein